MPCRSHLARDAWVEIQGIACWCFIISVASRKRCVSWNKFSLQLQVPYLVASRKRCVSWNLYPFLFHPHYPCRISQEMRELKCVLPVRITPVAKRRISQEMRELKSPYPLTEMWKNGVASRKRCVSWNIFLFHKRSTFFVASRKRCVSWNYSGSFEDFERKKSHLARDAWVEI